jgi:hypothetical protein
MRILTFNSAATAAIHGRKGAKLRLDAKDGTLFLRPTDRKAGPHVLSEIEAGKSKTVSVQITDKQLEKLGVSDLIADNSTFGLVQDKYGWFAMRSAEDAGDKAIEGAEVSITEKAEPAAETADA